MTQNTKDIIKSLPAVESVLQDREAAGLISDHGREIVTKSVRQAIGAVRKEILAGNIPDSVRCSVAGIIREVAQELALSSRPNLKKVVNATGIILHTGLGRAFMPEAAKDELARVTGYCNLQQDLSTGQRDRREECIRGLVKELTGAEEVAVVNNNAGATFLVLAALARGREVVISRGELIEIGGSFRLPDIMKESGAILREVGTTNKTHLKDYEGAVGPQTAMIMKAHKSNYKIVGFSKEVGIDDIAKVGKKHKVTVVDDLGCGALVGLEQFGIGHECTVRESLEAGADVALFSTDKLIGGPQGGMIVGRADLLAKILAHPLYRILRVCKLTLGALEATLRLFRSPDLLAKTHPVYRMISKTQEEMKAQAEELKILLSGKCPNWELSVTNEISYLGGGSLPEADMPSVAVRIKVPDMRADAVALGFRKALTPVIPRVADDHVILDMRTVFPEDLQVVVKAAEGVGEKGR